jgi:hypothetical protein
VAVRVNAPSLGATGYQPGGTWTAAVGYRWQKSDRHFTGEHEDVERLQQGTEVINDINLVDISLSYAFSKRVTGTLTIPLQFATRSQLLRSNDVNRTPLMRYETEASGLGDIRFLVTSWLLDPDHNKKQNISLGLGVKLPTGEKDAQDIFPVFQGGQILAQKRTVDQSIQPGDGGFGLIFDVLAFKEIFERTTAYLAGTYIMTPEERSGVPTFRNNPFEAEMSIADQYLGRLGVGYVLVPDWGLAVTFGGRVEGVPVYDLVGGSEGFRRPGMAASLEPGIVVAKNGWTASLSAPVAVYRNREQSVPDKEFQRVSPRDPPRHGDAAFADYMILFSLGRRY